MVLAPGFVLLDASTAQAAVVLHLDDADTTRVGPRTYRKRILRFGKWSHRNAPGGVLTVDRPFADRLVANFNDRIWDHVTIPYGHPANEAESAVNSAGEVVGLEVTQAGDPATDGVWATCLFDAEHADTVGTKVKGCSAGLIPDYTDHEVGGKGNVGPVLAHLALTNEPYIKGLGAFAPVELSEDAPVLTLSTEEDTPPMNREELLAALKNDHGIDVEALQADVTAKDVSIAALSDENEALKATPVVDPAPAAEAKAEATKEIVTALGNALTGSGLVTLSEGEDHTLQSVLTAVVGGLKQATDAKVELAETKATAAVDAAVRSGRIVPEKRDAFKALYLSAGEEVFTGLLPDEPIIDLSEHGDTGAEAGSTSTDPIDTDAEVERIAALVGEI